MESTPHQPKIMDKVRLSPMVKSFKGKIINTKPEEEQDPATNKSNMVEPEANVSKDEILANYIDQQ